MPHLPRNVHDLIKGDAATVLNWEAKQQHQLVHGNIALPLPRASLVKRRSQGSDHMETGELTTTAGLGSARLFPTFGIKLPTRRATVSYTGIFCHLPSGLCQPMHHRTGTGVGGCSTPSPKKLNSAGTQTIVVCTPTLKEFPLPKTQPCSARLPVYAE